ncbi:MAG TPA: DUF3857 domain-containing protein [bacterium (Candidatus Stahlbacteria)]|nr:DUF3857 domain-containing protein [Candidatus Stahlbacteria bacterium]
MRKYLPNITILLVIFSLTCAKRALAQVQLPLLAEVSSENYPDAHTVIVFDSTVVVVDTEGEKSRTQHKLIKILTPYGRDKFSEATITYCTAYETTYVLMARVIRPNGIVIDVKKQDIKDLPIPVSENLNLFIPNVRIKKIIFPQLEVGSAIEWKVQRIFKKPPMENNFSEFLVFADTEPIISKAYTLKMPVGMPLNYRVRNGMLGFKESTIGNNKIYSWEARDVPMIMPEPAMPPLPDVATKLLVTTFTSWDALSKWYYELAKESFEPNDAIAEKVNELTSTAQDDKEKIMSIYQFVNQNIRCVEPVLLGIRKIYKPAPAPITFENRYGSRADIAALLVAMLKKLGIDAYVALTSSSIIVEDDIPAYQFDRTIVAVKQEDGTYLYMDPVEGQMYFLTPYEQNKGILVCSRNGEDLAFTPIVSVDKNVINVMIRSKLRYDKTIEGSITIKPEGFFDWMLRTKFSLITALEMKQMFQKMVRDISTSAKLTEFYASDVSDIQTPITIEMRYNASSYGVETEDRIYFKPPGPTSLLTSICILGQIESTTWDLPKRVYPIYLESTIGIRIFETVETPSEYVVEAVPDSIYIEYKDFSYKVSYKVVEKNKVTGEIELLLKSPFIPTTEYSNLRNMLKEVALTGNKVIILSTK